MARENSRQAKMARKARKSAKKERRQDQRQRAWRPSHSLLSGIEEAEASLKEGNLGHAVEVLEDLQRSYPRRAEVLGVLLRVYHQQKDMWSYQATLQRMVELDEDHEFTWLALAGAAMENGQPATAYRAFQHFLSHWPDSPVADESRAVMVQLEAVLHEEVIEKGLQQDEGVDLLFLHDEMWLHLQRGDYDKVASAAEQLLQRCPTFAPALNNRSEAWFRLGRIDLAIADVRRVLEFDANNFHALSNLARYLFLAGRSEEAVETARRLTDCKSTSPDLYVKQAEALVFLADWPCVLNALHQAESRDDFAHGADGGLLYHLAGVAAAELGQLDVAREHWKRAAKLGLVSSWAKHNLDDLRLPIGEQNGPWAYPIDYWIPRPVFDGLIAGMAQAGPKAKDADVRRRVRRFLGQHPHIERILPHLLERGEPIAKEFVVRLASLAETPSFFAALRDFAFGRRGPDRLRHQAAMVLVEAGQLAPGRQRLWCEGELRELALMGYVITPEPLHALPKEIERLAKKAHDAIRSQDGALAESLLVEAMQQRPDDPSLQYNRAVAILLQGREKEAMSLVRDIHARYPDYLFARVRLAEDAVKRRDFDAARSLLDPLMERNRFHQSEFAAMCNANIELLAARGDKEGARIWLDMWQRTDSNDPRAKQWNGRLDKRGFLGRFFAE